jgi:hypothetical protein
METRWKVREVERKLDNAEKGRKGITECVTKRIRNTE